MKRIFSRLGLSFFWWYVFGIISTLLLTQFISNPMNTSTSESSSMTVVEGPQGPAGEPGADGQDGADGLTPYIGTNGNWWIGTTDTGIPATGPAGEDGSDGQDGAPGADGQDGAPGADGQDGQTIVIAYNEVTLLTYLAFSNNGGVIDTVILADDIVVEDVFDVNNQWHAFFLDEDGILTFDFSGINLDDSFGSVSFQNSVYLGGAEAIIDGETTPLTTINLLDITINPTLGSNVVDYLNYENSQYTASFTWYEDAQYTVFANTNNTFALTQYYAKAILTPKRGFTVTGIAENSFNFVNGTSTTNNQDSDEVRGSFTFTIPPIPIRTWEDLSKIASGETRPTLNDDGETVNRTFLPDENYILKNNLTPLTSDYATVASDNSNFSSSEYLISPNHFQTHGIPMIQGFTGDLDGNGFVLQGYNVGLDRGSSTSSAPTTEGFGLFRKNNGTIRRLGVLDANVYITAENDHPFNTYAVSPFVGVNEGVIEEVFVADSRFFNNSQGDFVAELVGGIVGSNQKGGTVKNSYVHNIELYARSSYGAGAVVGINTYFNTYESSDDGNVFNVYSSSVRFFFEEFIAGTQGATIIGEVNGDGNFDQTALKSFSILSANHYSELYDGTSKFTFTNTNALVFFFFGSRNYDESYFSESDARTNWDDEIWEFSLTDGEGHKFLWEANNPLLQPI
jgi:hypothetical protein